MKTAATETLPDAIEAVVLDLEGVITQTALLHARAWKTTFDTFLKGRTNGQAFLSMSIREDYRHHFEGKSCPDGIRSFLASRNVQLPEGSARDAPGTETLHGLGNLKDKRFLRLIEEEGVDVFADTVARIRQWRAEGKKIAVVAPGKYGASILSRAGLDPLFDLRVDGAAMSRPEPAGPPAPDLFVQAARELGVPPRRVMVIQPARPGEPANSREDFGLVVGIARHAHGEEALAQYGADVIVKSLADLDIPHSRPDRSSAAAAADLPPALAKLKAMGSEPFGKHLAFFLDYDGTLAPIAAHPDEARMPESVRELVRQLAGLCTVAIVSGRDRADVEKMVGLPGLIYAGSHGFDITGPDGLTMQHPEADAYLPDLYNAQRVLKSLLDDAEGVQLERKKYALAVHYRNVPEAEVAFVKDAVYRIGRATERLTITTGKKVLELRPALDWHKGKAVGWIMEALHLDPAKVVPIYLCDDVTGEDAFRFVRNSGVGILVGEHGGPTQAVYRLEDISQVEQLLLIAVQFIKK